MGIKFNPKFSDGSRMEVNDFCFRELGKSTMSRYYQVNDQRDVVARYSDKQIDLSTVHWFPMKSTETDGPENYSEQSCLKLMKEVINAVPFARTVLKAEIHPVEKTVVVSALAGDNPCDKTITALFLVRNVFYLDDSNELYNKCRESGLSVMASLLIGLNFTIARGFGGVVKIYKKTIGEYNLFNPHTFGKQGLINFITHGEDWNPWRQGSWKQQRFYKREYHLELGDRLLDFDGDLTDPSILDCFSISHDEDIWGAADEEHGAYEFEDIVDKLVGVYREAGRNPY